MRVFFDDIGGNIITISRRQFIVGMAAGFIPPSYFDKVFSYIENMGEALLQKRLNDLDTGIRISIQ